MMRDFIVRAVMLITGYEAIKVRDIKRRYQGATMRRPMKHVGYRRLERRALPGMQLAIDEVRSGGDAVREPL